MTFLAYFGLLLHGTIGGLIPRVTPGLSPTMAVVSLIPFTFRLEAAQGLILPGAAVEFPDTDSGAMGVGLWTVASVLVGKSGRDRDLIARFKFGREGLLSGCIGSWLSTIGFDERMGAQRFIFYSALGGGINVIPALVGLFGVPQAIPMSAEGRVDHASKVILAVQQPIRLAVREVFVRTRALSIGTGTGSIFSLIPGVGGQIAGLGAYDQTRTFSPEREKFDTGQSEGVIAAESANNVMVGLSLVPRLTLSIPDSPIAAVLLDALLIHGFSRARTSLKNTLMWHGRSSISCFQTSC